MAAHAKARAHRTLDRRNVEGQGGRGGPEWSVAIVRQPGLWHDQRDRRIGARSEKRNERAIGGADQAGTALGRAHAVRVSNVQHRGHAGDHGRGLLVNHVPVMTGGVGHAELRQFYATHFIPKMPPDMEMTPLSRTIGTDQLVDEMVVRFTHTVEMDWMLPGSRPPESGSRSRWSSSFISATASSLTSTSTGTKP